MDFSLPLEAEAFRQKVQAFVTERILPLEADPASYDEHENIDPALRDRVRAEVRAEGMWAPAVPRGEGGLGLSFVALAAAYEEMNRSIFGPCCFNAAAPEDGNMRLLAQIGTDAQREWWLRPVVAGEMRSAFAMTEPHPGSGSDPTMMRTQAERRGDKWVVHGRKWFITGADGAERFILVARTGEDSRKGLTAFLYDAAQPGWEIERRVPIMGPEEHGGHCELVFDGLEIDDTNRLLEIGDGLKITQIRLGPARLTHCMRWLGLAKRCVEIAEAYAAERMGFGVKLADRESVQIQLGTLAHEIEVGRLLVMRAAWLLDQGDRAKSEISMAKIHVAEILNRTAAACVQICGARGYSRDTILEWVYRYAPQARLVDGADAVHRMVLYRARRERGAEFWRWGI